MKDYREKAEQLIKYLGGAANITTVTNCMTRVRVTVLDESLVSEQQIKVMEDVMGIVHDRALSYEIVVGPGKSRKYADECRELGFEASNTANAHAAIVHTGDDWQKNKEELQRRKKGGRIKAALKVFGDIFVPLIPGIITAGLCAGFAALITQAVPDYDHIKVWNIIYNLLTLCFWIIILCGTQSCVSTG